MQFSELKSKFVDDTPIGENNPYFQKVNGIENVEQLLLAPSHIEKSEIRLTASEEKRKEIRDAVIRTLTSSICDFRRLSGYGSYEACASIEQGKIHELLKNYCELAEIKKASVIDFGCGQGNALGDLGKLSCIDPENIIGITMPLRYMDGKAPHVTKSHNPNVKIANTLFLKLKQEFDIAFSIFGIRSYHPYGKEFGLLQMITALKEGGLLITAPDYESLQLIPELLKNDVLSQPKRITEFKRGCWPPLAYILKRKPSHDEMCEFALEVSGKIQKLAA